MVTVEERKSGVKSTRGVERVGIGVQDISRRRAQRYVEDKESARVEELNRKINTTKENIENYDNEIQKQVKATIRFEQDYYAGILPLNTELQRISAEQDSYIRSIAGQNLPAQDRMPAIQAFKERQQKISNQLSEWSSKRKAFYDKLKELNSKFKSELNTYYKLIGEDKTKSEQVYNDYQKEVQRQLSSETAEAQQRFDIGLAGFAKGIQETKRRSGDYRPENMTPSELEAWYQTGQDVRVGYGQTFKDGKLVSTTYANEMDRQVEILAGGTPQQKEQARQYFRETVGEVPQVNVSKSGQISYLFPTKKVEGHTPQPLMTVDTYGTDKSGRTIIKTIPVSAQRIGGLQVSEGTYEKFGEKMRDFQPTIMSREKFEPFESSATLSMPSETDQILQEKSGVTQKIDELVGFNLSGEFTKGRQFVSEVFMPRLSGQPLTEDQKTIMTEEQQRSYNVKRFATGVAGGALTFFPSLISFGTQITTGLYSTAKIAEKSPTKAIAYAGSGVKGTAVAMYEGIKTDPYGQIGILSGQVFMGGATKSVVKDYVPESVQLKYSSAKQSISRYVPKIKFEKAVAPVKAEVWQKVGQAPKGESSAFARLEVFQDVKTGRQVPTNWYEFSLDPTLADQAKWSGVAVEYPSWSRKYGTIIRESRTLVGKSAGKKVPRFGTPKVDYTDVDVGALRTEAGHPYVQTLTQSKIFERSFPEITTNPELESARLKTTLELSKVREYTEATTRPTLTRNIEHLEPHVFEDLLQFSRDFKAGKIQVVGEEPIRVFHGYGSGGKAPPEFVEIAGDFGTKQRIVELGGTKAELGYGSSVQEASIEAGKAKVPADFDMRYPVEQVDTNILAKHIVSREAWKLKTNKYTYKVLESEPSLIQAFDKKTGKPVGHAVDIHAELGLDTQRGALTKVYGLKLDQTPKVIEGIRTMKLSEAQLTKGAHSALSPREFVLKQELNAPRKIKITKENIEKFAFDEGIGLSPEKHRLKDVAGFENIQRYGQWIEKPRTTKAVLKELEGYKKLYPKEIFEVFTPEEATAVKPFNLQKPSGSEISTGTRATTLIKAPRFGEKTEYKYTRSTKPSKSVLVSPSIKSYKSPSKSPSMSISPRRSVSVSPSKSISKSPSASARPSVSLSPYTYKSKSVSPSASVSVYRSKSVSPSPSISPSPSPSISPSISPSPSPLLISTSPRSSRPKSKGQPSYSVQIKRFGKWQTVGTGLTKAEAIVFGKTEAKRTLGATFKLTESDTSISGKSKYTMQEAKNLFAGEFRTYQIKGGQKIELKDTFIQEKTKRLGTKGEKIEIQEARFTIGNPFGKSKNKKTKGVKWY